MKAHRSAQDCKDFREMWERRGNDLADRMAKRGAASWRPHRERRLVAAGAHALAKATARWVAESTVWLQDQAQDADGLPPSAFVEVECGEIEPVGGAEDVEAPAATRPAAAAPPRAPGAWAAVLHEGHHVVQYGDPDAG